MIGNQKSPSSTPKSSESAPAVAPVETPIKTDEPTIATPKLPVVGKLDVKKPGSPSSSTSTAKDALVTRSSSSSSRQDKSKRISQGEYNKGKYVKKIQSYNRSFNKQNSSEERRMKIRRSHEVKKYERSSHESRSHLKRTYERSSHEKNPQERRYAERKHHAERSHEKHSREIRSGEEKFHRSRDTYPSDKTYEKISLQRHESNYSNHARESSYKNKVSSRSFSRANPFIHDEQMAQRKINRSSHGDVINLTSDSSFEDYDKSHVKEFSYLPFNKKQMFEEKRFKKNNFPKSSNDFIISDEERIIGQKIAEQNRLLNEQKLNSKKQAMLHREELRILSNNTQKEMRREMQLKRENDMRQMELEKMEQRRKEYYREDFERSRKKEDRIRDEFKREEHERHDETPRMDKYIGQEKEKRLSPMPYVRIAQEMQMPAFDKMASSSNIVKTVVNVPSYSVPANKQIYGQGFDHYCNKEMYILCII